MSRKRNLKFESQLRLLASRQIDDRFAPKIQSQLHVTEKSIMRLGLEKELEGHDGCVNCLEWNDKGSLLLSASDDVRFILWDPLLYKKKVVFETGHQGNIFSVKFIPFTSDCEVVTAAGDCKIRIHDINKGFTTTSCSCHTGRVKRIATAPSVPYMFWSAAEDGLIMEFDTRVAHSCTKQLNSVLVNLCVHLGRSAEAKCLAINPYRPEQIAVGANDPYIRIYDRRMIRPMSIRFPPAQSLFERYQFVQTYPENNLTENCVQYFVAGHLAKKMSHTRKKYRPVSTTYLTYSPAGTDLLVNIGGEQVYLFDINNKRKMKEFDLSLTGDLPFQSNAHSKCNCVGPKKMTTNRQIIENYEKAGNKMCGKEHFSGAIQEYNKAVSLCSASAQFYDNRAVLHANRAAALMKRSWDGDMYAALRDCFTTLELDPNHIQTYFRLARCLFKLKFVEESSKCLTNFQTMFPDQAHSMACKALALDIEKYREKEINASNRLTPDSEEDIHIPRIRNYSRNITVHISETERKWRSSAYDYENRYCGHCNTTTDIKEANFFGRDGQFIVAGSDDGSFYIWDRHTSNIVQVIKGDGSIVNCLQPHPSACILATSGIDPVVRLWSPLPEDGTVNNRAVSDLEDAALANQKRMNADPFEVMLVNMGFNIPHPINEDMPPSEEWGQPVSCRTS